MYKVQLFMDWTIKTVDKITLVKGLPNELNAIDGTRKSVETPPAHSLSLYEGLDGV